MNKAMVLSRSGQHYAEAYGIHYGIKDLNAALIAYKDIVVRYPDTKEAGYSRSQVLNIVRDVVPGELLFKVQLNLALNYSNRNNTSHKRKVASPPPVMEFSV